MINLAGAMAPLLVTLLTLPLLLPLVGEFRYGAVLMVWTIIGYLGVTDLGLGRATNNRIARMEAATAEDRANVLWTSLALSGSMGLAGGLLLYVLGERFLFPFLSISPELQHEFHDTLPLLLLALPLTTISSVLAGALEGRQAFVSLNIANLTGSVIAQVLPVLVAWAGWIELPALIAAMLAGRLVTSSLLMKACLRHVSSKRPRPSSENLKHLLHFGGWVSVSSVLNPVLTLTDRIVIGHKLDMAAVTAYTVPYTMATRLSMIPASLSSVLFPRFSSADHANEAAPLMVRARLPLAIIMTPTIVLAMLLSTPFMSWWLGESLGERMGPVVIILLAGIWINALSYIPFAFLQGLGRPDLTAKLHLIEVGPYLVFLWWALDLWGIQGAAFAWSVRVGIDAILLFILAKGPWPDLRPIMSGGLLVLTTAVSALVQDAATPLALITALSLLTLTGLWAWKNSPSEISSLFSELRSRLWP
jgi:O-antigen/teichoic acid export membrane protein